MRSDDQKGFHIVSKMLAGSLAFMGICLLLATNVADYQESGANALAAKAAKAAKGGSNTEQIELARDQIAKAEEHQKKAVEAEKQLVELKKKAAAQARYMADVDAKVDEATRTVASVKDPPGLSPKLAEKLHDSEGDLAAVHAKTKASTIPAIATSKNGEEHLVNSPMEETVPEAKEEEAFETLAIKKMLAEAAHLDPTNRDKVIGMARVIIRRMARKREAAMLRTSQAKPTEAKADPVKQEPAKPVPPPPQKAAAGENLKAEILREVHAEVQNQVSVSIRDEMKPLLKMMQQLVHTSVSVARQHPDEKSSAVSHTVHARSLDEREDETIDEVDAMINKVDAEIAEAKLHGD